MGATHSSKNGGGSNHASPTAPDPSLATNVTGGGTTRCSTCGESYCPTTDLAKYGCRCQRHGGDGDIISQSKRIDTAPYRFLFLYMD
ncbi:hypothetical protein Pelo_10050 [Pelomyxa schiedti]|nr:hypothetical protein Pelo_10050 [Pelomyxa schiedti]